MSSASSAVRWLLSFDNLDLFKSRLVPNRQRWCLRIFIDFSLLSISHFLMMRILKLANTKLRFSFSVLYNIELAV